MEVFDLPDRTAWIVVRDDQEFELATNREWPEGGRRGREGREGKILRDQWFGELAEALEAAGLRE